MKNCVNTISTVLSNACGRNAVLSARVSTSALFAYTYAVRFFEYCYFYYYFMKKKYIPQRTLGLALL